MNTRKKTCIAVLALAALFALAAGLLFGLLRPTASAVETLHAEGSIRRVEAALEEGIRVKYAAKLPQGYSDPVLEVVRGDVKTSLAQYTESNGEIVFSYGGVQAAYADEDVAATLYATDASGARVALDAADFNVVTYYSDILASSAEELGMEEDFGYVSLRTLAANALNFFGAVSGKSFLSDLSMIYFYEDPYAEGNWEMRDFPSADAVSASGFSWWKATVDVSQGFYLRFRFSAASNFSNLRAKITVDGKEEWIVPVATGETNSGNPVYAFGRPFDITEFSADFDADVEVYNGTTRIGAVNYGVNRAISDMNAYPADYPARSRVIANALWGLGKAAVWQRDWSRMKYTTLHNFNREGMLVGSRYDYVYDDSRMLLAEQTVEVTQPAIYLNGALIDAAHAGDFEGYSVSYADGAFTVTLKGAEISGLIATDEVNVVLSVEKDSVISGSFFRDMADRQAHREFSVYVNGDLTIVGNAALEVDGAISAEHTFTTQCANLVISSDGTGIDAMHADSELRFVSGRTTIVAARGIRTGHILLGAEASLSVTASQYGVGTLAEPASLTTESGAAEQGSLSVTVSGNFGDYEESGNGYALIADTVRLDGGTVTLASANAGGVVRMGSGYDWDLDHCAFTVRSTAVTSAGNSYGVYVSGGNAAITLHSGATLTIRDANAAIVCWVSPAITLRSGEDGAGALVFVNRTVTEEDWDMQVNYEGITPEIG